MRLDVHGHPLHTRALRVALTQRRDGKLDTHAYLLDLRKRGFVPVAGDLQSSGIVHHMCLDGIVDPDTQILETIAARQPAVAFEPSAVTGGESCRDPIGRIDALAGVRLDADYARRLSDELGGPRGCSHILTLAQLLGSTIAWALAHETGASGWTPKHRPGERVFERDLILDGHESGEGRLQIAFQLIDLHFAPAPALARPMERFGSQLDVRALATIEMGNLTVAELTAAERRRGLDDLEEAVWRDRTEIVAGLAGTPVLRGATRELLQRLGDIPDDRPLLDALLMLSPMFIQCAGAISNSWSAMFKQSSSLVGMGGFPDSCYMWRRGGGLSRSRKDESSEPSNPGTRARS